MRKAANGDRVQVHYRALTENGDLFMDSETAGPLEFIIGDESFFADIGAAIVGLQIGETASLRLLPDRAFGPHRSELVRHLSRTFFRTDQQLELGTRLVFKSENAQTEFRVTSVDSHSVTMDANHPFAGKTLTFEVKLAAIY